MGDAKRTAQKSTATGLLGKLRVFLKTLGPGLITGASDDDPSGIGTYAQTGALFGFAQLWTALITLPMMIAIQEACARIALQTGAGLAENLRRHYARPILFGCVVLLFVANVFNIGADLGAMAASARMLVGLPFSVWLIFMALLSVTLQVFVSYRQYAQVLRYLTLTLFTYILVAFVVHLNWKQALHDTVIPTMYLTKDYWLNLVAILGTTISPYLFFWQANQEVEERVRKAAMGGTPPDNAGATRAELRWMRSDVVTGMLFSNVVTWFIIATTASTLFRLGITHIDSAVEAAQVLQPLAGVYAYLLFAVGIIGTGLLVVPILAGSAAYAIAEAFRWREGLYLTLRQAPGFYGVIILAMLIGAAINMLGINPIRALYYSAALNGIIAPPLLVMIMLIASNRSIMRQRVNGSLSNIVGWLTTLAMTLAALALLASLFWTN
jgi:NRAMP (natural resistance-associated macrophage protein)-like metal ion transporter